MLDLPAEDLTRASCGESSSDIAREWSGRGKECSRGKARRTHDFPLGKLINICVPDEQGALRVKQAISRLGVSARGYHRILKIARTIADLAGSESVSSAYVAEAIQYRRLDRPAT